MTKGFVEVTALFDAVPGGYQLLLLKTILFITWLLELQDVEGSYVPSVLIA